LEKEGKYMEKERKRGSEEVEVCLKICDLIFGG
jgi:hypothetical protein